MALRIAPGMHRRSMTLLRWSALALMCGIGACQTGPVSFERHNLSRLWVPEGADVIYFDATTTLQYPANSVEAEATRQAWLQEWMGLRNLCNNGYEQIERRQFTRADDNPYQHDLRYVLRCR